MLTFFHNFRMYQCSTSFLSFAFSCFLIVTVVINLLLVCWTLFQFSVTVFRTFGCSTVPNPSCRLIKSWKLKNLKHFKTPKIIFLSQVGYFRRVEWTTKVHVHNRSELMFHNLHPLKLTLLRIVGTERKFSQGRMSVQHKSLLLR